MLTELTEILTVSEGAGDGGAIRIHANELQLGVATIIDSSTFSLGDGGTIMINAANMSIDLGFIQSTGVGAVGDPGDIIIRANDMTITNNSVITSGTNDIGTAGKIILTADRIVLSDGTRVESSFHIGVELASGEFVLESILFGNPFFDLPSIIETSIPITPSDVEQLIGIDVEIFQGMRILTSCADTGCTLVPFDSNDYLLATEGEFEGRVFVVVRDPSIGENAVVFLPFGAGGAGDVLIRAGELMIEDAIVETESAVSVGGRTSIEATDLIHLIDTNVTSNGVRPVEDNSVITLRASRIVLNGSQITSLTGEGEPLVGSGEARLLGDVTVISADSEVAASSTVEIRGQDTDLGSQLVALEGAIVDAAPLRERCSVRRDVGASSFTNVGRGGLPTSPDAPLRSDYRGASPEASMNAASEGAVSGVGAHGSMLHLTGCSGVP